LCSFFLHAHLGLLALHSFPTRRSSDLGRVLPDHDQPLEASSACSRSARMSSICSIPMDSRTMSRGTPAFCSSSSLSWRWVVEARSEEHTSELQSRENLVCRLLLEKKKN